MRRSLKIPLLIVGGLVAAILLVSGGFLLGARDDLSSALRGLVPRGRRLVGVRPMPYRPAAGSARQARLDLLQSGGRHEAARGLPSTAWWPALNDPYTVYWDPQEYASFKESTSGCVHRPGDERRDEGRASSPSSPRSRAARPIRPASLPATSSSAVDGAVGPRHDPRRGRDHDEGRRRGHLGQRRDLPAAGLGATTTTTDGPERTGSGARRAAPPRPPSPATADLSHLPPGGETQGVHLARKTIEIPVTETKILQAGDKKVALIGFYTFSQGSAAALRAGGQAGDRGGPGGCDHPRPPQQRRRPA